MIILLGMMLSDVVLESRDARIRAEAKWIWANVHGGRRGGTIVVCTLADRLAVTTAVSIIAAVCNDNPLAQVWLHLRGRRCRSAPAGNRGHVKHHRRVVDQGG